MTGHQNEQSAKAGQPSYGQEDPLPPIVSSSSWKKMSQRNFNSLRKIPQGTIHVI